MCRAPRRRCRVRPRPRGSSAPIKPVPGQDGGGEVVSRRCRRSRARYRRPGGDDRTSAGRRFRQLGQRHHRRSSAPRRGARPGILGVLPAVVTRRQECGCANRQGRRGPCPARHTRRGGWAIQIGAYEDEGEAKERLNSAQSKASSLLEKADAYTERTTKGDKTYYRARFAGFDRNRAHAVCRQLKRSEISCMALKI